MKAGATDFVEKSEDLDEHLEMALARLQPVWGLVAENEALQAEVDRLKEAATYYQHELFKKYQIVGNSSAVRSVVQLIEEVAPIPRPVLVRGERGSGKELVAAAIHKASERAGGPCGMRWSGCTTASCRSASCRVATFPTSCRPR